MKSDYVYTDPHHITEHRACTLEWRFCHDPVRICLDCLGIYARQPAYSPCQRFGRYGGSRWPGDRDFRHAGGADQPLPFPACREYKPQTPSSGHDAPDGALGDDYRFRPKLSGLHDRPRADRYRYRRHKVARALAIFNGGNALATVVAAPLGSYLGATIGWRGAFLCLVPVAIVAFIWQCLSLPDMNARKNGTSRGSVFRLFRQPAVSVGLLACGLFFMGQFALFTYLRPFLETVTRVSGAGLSLILLTIGVAGFVGTLFVALVLNAAFYITLIAIPLLMAAITVALILAGHNVWIVALLSGLWGMLATSAPTGWWTWIARTLPKDAEAGGGLMVAVIQLAIALGSTAGGIAFDRYSWQSTFALSGIVLLFAAALTFLLSRLHK